MGAKSKGFTLVELLITLAMTAIIAASVYGIFGVQTVRNAAEERTIQMQQGARVAIEMIAQDLRSAGFWGLGNPEAQNTVRGGRSSDSSTNIFLGMAPIQGLNDLAADNAFPAKSGTDLLVVSFADGDREILTIRDQNGVERESEEEPINNVDFPVPTRINNSSEKVKWIGQIALAIAADGQTASIFQITNVTKKSADNFARLKHVTNNTGDRVKPANWTGAITNPFASGTSIFPMKLKYYWVTPQNELKLGMGFYDSSGKQFKPYLENGVWQHKAQTIAEHIEDLQFEYGEDTFGDGNYDGTPDQWVTADAVSDWRHVIAVKVELLARTSREEKDYIDRTYGDHYRHFRIERTIALRNRMP